MTARTTRALAALAVALCPLAVSLTDAQAAAAPPPQVCTVPTAVNAFAIGGGAAVVQWNPLGCSFYAVYAFSYTATPQMLPVAYEGAAVVGGLTVGDAYTFTVIGYDGATWVGWSGYSNWMTPASGGAASQFDGTTLNGWNGNPSIWSVKDGAIDGTTSNGGQLIYSSGNYGTFRIIGSARMVQNLANHLGVCFWGSRSATGWGYGGCIDFVPPSGSIWDYGGGGGVRTLPDFFKDRWNQFEILANLQTGVVRMAVNGTEFPVYTDTRLAQRKAGPIGLQIHAGASEVQYKDIYIDPAPTTTTLIT